MKLVDLKKKYGEDATIVTGPSGDNEYYCPSLYLEDKQIEAMGIDNARVGAEFVMLAKVKLTSLSEFKSGRSMSFDILEAGMKPKEDDKDAASILFPNG